jgi:hypothetical protein
MDASWGPLIASAVSGGAKALKAADQRREARRLKESTFTPEELLLNKDLAQMQAFSKRSPGQAKAEELIRRGQANSLNAIKRAAGGDVNKITAGSIASQGAMQDAADRIQVRDNEFSQGAFNRLAGANSALAANKRHNRSEFNSAKIALLAASDQNYMNAFNDILNGAMASSSMKTGWGGYGGGGSGSPGSRGTGTVSGSGYVPPTDSLGRFYPSNSNAY